MPQLSGIYDAYYVQPVAKIRENLSILTAGKWNHYWIDYSEPIAPGPASIVDMVVQATATSLAGGGIIAQIVVAILQVNDYELLQVRFEPIDNVEGIVWERSGQGKFQSRNIHVRVDRNTRLRDPSLSTTQFWIMGLNRDMNLQARNTMNYALPAARFMFWGHRYILKDVDLTGVSSAEKTKLADGDLNTVRNIIGTTTWLPAEGKMS